MAPVVWIVAVALFAWTYWLSGRSAHPRRIKTIGVGVGALIASLPLITVVLLIRAFQRVGSPGVAAAERQAALSSGISGAMIPTAVAIAGLLVWLIVLLVATLRRGRANP